MADNKRTRTAPPAQKGPTGENDRDFALEDTIAPAGSAAALGTADANDTNDDTDANDTSDADDDLALGATIAPTATPATTPVPSSKPVVRSGSGPASGSGSGSGPASGNPDDADPTLARGDTVGRYVVLDLLGKGGMGEVYTAYDPELDRRIALKVLHAAVRAGGDPDVARTRLLREAQTLAKLSHPNVVAVYDVGAIEKSGGQEGDVYVAMEYVEGCDLRRWLEAEERSLTEILDVFIAAASGLAAAHDEGLVHRDVKPDNLLIGDDGRVRVIDFGIAYQDSETVRDKDELVAELAASSDRKLGTDDTLGVLIGTPAYMTPEQFLGSSAGGRSDQFSLCVALFEAVSGERPFPGKTLPELSANVLDNKRRELTIGPQIPTWLAAALEKGLAPDPEDRHVDMRALAAELTPPAPRKRGARWLVAASAVVAVGGITAAYMLGGAKAAEKSCNDVGDEVGAAWNDTNKRAIEATFAGVDPRHGAETFTRAAKVLDKYAGEWSRARVKTCRETVSRQLTPMTAEKKLACLEGGLRELRAVTAVLATADDALIEEAVNTASSITPVAECSNLSRVIAAPTLPEEIDQALATIKALERAGRYKQGLEEVDKVLIRADALGSKLGRARALVWRGRLESQQRDTDAAIESLFEAIRVAADVGDTVAPALAWTYLVYVVGAHKRERLAALRWAKHAEIAIEMDGSPLTVEARRLYHVALAHRGLNRFDEALTEFRRATQFAEQAHGVGSYETVAPLIGEAMSMRSLERLDESVEIYKRVLALMTELLGADNPKLALVEGNLGIVLVELHRYDEGRESYQRALDLKRDKLGPEHPSVLITELNMAVLEERLGNYEVARAGIDAVHAIRLKRFGDDYPQLPNTLLTQASLAVHLGDLREAEALDRRAIEIFAARGEDGRESLASARIALCNVLRRARRLAEARRSCAMAVASLREKVEDVRILASALTESAHVELDARRADVALAEANEATAIRQANPSDEASKVQTSYVLARALAADPAQRARARELASEARAQLATLHVGEQNRLRGDLDALWAQLEASATP